MDLRAIRNLAVLAHVDHGKTTLVDAMLWQGPFLGASHPGAAEGAGEERAKEVRVMPPFVSLFYSGVRLNLLDTPGPGELANEVERVLRCVEGLLYIVDAVEGPALQTRFALHRALALDKVPLVVINKTDLPGARPREVADQVHALLRELKEGDLPEPVILYANARKGTAAREPGAEAATLRPLFEAILSEVPPPRPGGSSDATQFFAARLLYDDYLGRMALGRVFQGRLQVGQQVARHAPDGFQGEGVVASILRQEGLEASEVVSAGPGEIVAVTGVQGLRMGEVLASPGAEPLDFGVPLETATLEVEISVSRSPLAGAEGPAPSAERLRERLYQEVLGNPAIQISEAERPEAFRLAAPGELPLVILLEMLRREGFELAVGRPRILTRLQDGREEEPVERLFLDVPEDSASVLDEKLAARGGERLSAVPGGAGRVRSVWRIPSRGLLGFRAEFLADTRGRGLFRRKFEGFAPQGRPVAPRRTGVLVAERAGRVTESSVAHLQHRGTLFVAPGDPVYEGMIVGEHAGSGDVWVDVTKERRSAADRPEGPRHPLLPPRMLSLEQALEFIASDELVELTPSRLRLSKADSMQTSR